MLLKVSISTTSREIFAQLVEHVVLKMSTSSTSAAKMLTSTGVL